MPTRCTRDSYASDTHPWAGPTGHNATVTFSGKGPCAGMGVTHEKLLLLQCGGAQNFTLRLVDPVTLKDLATYDLPPRPSTMQAAENADLDKVYSDSSGAYFYLDNLDRAVVADAAQHIQRIRHVQAQDGSWSFVKTDDWDLSRYLPHDCTTYTNPLPQGSCDPVTGVLPDWSGLLWWISRYGRVGTLDPRTGKVHLLWLRGEQIENSHAVSEDGVAIVSDHAMYMFRADHAGRPSVVWRAHLRPRQRPQGRPDQPGLGHDADAHRRPVRRHHRQRRRADARPRLPPHGPACARGAPAVLLGPGLSARSERDGELARRLGQRPRRREQLRLSQPDDPGAKATSSRVA